MGPFSIPVAVFRTGMDMLTMVTEAQQVIAMRMLGMAGLWSVTSSESSRMVSEKLPALNAAGQAAMTAAAFGRRPDQIAAAWLAPVKKRTGANHKRLVRRGPKLS